MSKLLKNHKVLVLNKNWIAVNVISLQRAITILFSRYKDGNPKAEVVETADILNKYSTYTWDKWSKLKLQDNEKVIKGVNCSFRVPNVIRLSKNDRMPQIKTNFSRKAIFKRDNYTCQYCLKKLKTSEATIDHILPKSRNGGTTWKNVCCVCLPCNSRKRNRTPEEAGMRNPYPKEPKFNIFFKEDIKLSSFKDFISFVYWNCELENDM